MPYDLSKTHSVITGIGRLPDLACLVAIDDSLPREVEHSHIYSVHKGVIGYGGMLDWPTVAVTISQFPIQQMLIISPYGHVKLLGGGQNEEERIVTPDGDPSQRGNLRHVRTIEKRTFAVGMGRQVYRRDGQNQWTCLDQDIRPSDGEVKGFECIDGFNENDLYAVGWDGDIWHFDGSRWTQEESPTNQVLTRVLCAADGVVYASGRRGLLLKGRENIWEVIDQDVIQDDIWDLAWYQNRLYLSTLRELFTLSAGEIVPVDFGEDVPGSCYHLSASDGVLWSFGAKDMMAFDGQTWTRID